MNGLERLEVGIERLKRGKCSGMYALSVANKTAPSGDAGAVAWCAVGALDYVYGAWDASKERALEAVLAAGELKDLYTLQKWSDTHTQAEVVALFERAREWLTSST